ncbi:transmembrane protein 26-like isoform X2 [Amphiura filiformis]|uniref:transmembrane protein 26-like isoform X2 n=1 Tax=Amphiura filiformis TaxID=82378 RepID=UPI003B226ADD
MFLMLLEGFLTLKFTNGEWKWFLPSVFLYLLWVVPTIVILESHALDFRRAFRDEGHLVRCPLSFGEPCLGINQTVEKDAIRPPAQVEDPHVTLDGSRYVMARSFSLIMMQTMMLVLIAGRWLGPKGTLTRDQLSQLLLAYMGMAADMLEFATETLKMEQTACDDVLVYFVLGAWSWSLLQFTLGLTATKQRKPRVVATGPGIRAKVEVEPRTGFCAPILYCCETEIWALLVSVIMQDGPYLVIRLYIMFTFKTFAQTTIFFTCKNGILFLLQMYRMYVVIAHRHDNDEEENGDDKAIPLKVVKSKSPPMRKGNGKGKKPPPKVKKSPPKVKKSPLLKKSPKSSRPIAVKKSPLIKKPPEQMRKRPGKSGIL